MEGIHTWAVAAIRYTAGIVDWSVYELMIMNKEIIKIMTVNNALNLRADIDGLYIPRNKGVRGMVSVKECEIKDI